MDDRYSRQIAFTSLGAEGQRKLGDASVLVAGCGGLGCAAASALVRAGVGRVRVVDRDRIELSNLHRQLLYDEEDLRLGLPKAETAGRKLRLINSTVQVEALVTEINRGNVEDLIAGMSLVLDGTDNLVTRCFINDACVKHGKPWIYAGISGATGILLSIIPGEGPCLRCVFPDAMTGEPERGGPVLGPVPAAVASMQAIEACKILSGCEPSRRLLSFDLWGQVFRQIEVMRDRDCPACAKRRFDFLSGPR